MDEPIPQIRITLAILVGLVTMGYGTISYLTQVTSTTQPLIVTGAGAVIFLGGIFRWGYRNRKL